MSRFTYRCKCKGGRRAGRWVVLGEPEAAGKPYRLKCLACRWKFWSRAKFAATLPRHKEKSRAGMTDAEILIRICNGSLIVDVERAEVFSMSPRSATPVRLQTWERESNHSTYTFVQICANGKKKKIALHRLVWIAANRLLVPAGFDVDHVNGKQVAVPHAIHNLRLRPSGENRADKSRPSGAIVGDESPDWF